MDESPEFLERRSEERVPVTAPGRVWFGSNYSLWADCTVRNLSQRGIRIEIGAVYKLPRRLLLAHRLSDRIQCGIVKWQRGDAAGIAFEAAGLDDVPQQILDRILGEWRNLVAPSVS